jgi:YcaO-like protein with predicted kinase domain
MGGMGCHPAREIALARALTEAAQSRLTLIAGARDDLVTQRLASDAYLRAHAAFHAERLAPVPHRRYSDVPTRVHARLDEDLAFLLGRLREIGCGQAVAIDLTRPEVGIPVVRMVVPGLEVLNDLPGYSPGRRARARCRPREER